MLVVTFVATLTIQLEFAILVGVLVSLLVYLNRTTHPRITRVLPDADSPQRRFVAGRARRAASCPQLDVLRVDGSLFFGAVEHVRDELDACARERAGARARAAGRQRHQLRRRRRRRAAGAGGARDARSPAWPCTCAT